MNSFHYLTYAFTNPHRHPLSSIVTPQTQEVPNRLYQPVTIADEGFNGDITGKHYIMAIMRKYILATLENYKNKLNGRKVIILYLNYACLSCTLMS
jgi:hypothetical protein